MVVPLFSLLIYTLKLWHRSAFPCVFECTVFPRSLPPQGHITNKCPLRNKRLHPFPLTFLNNIACEQALYLGDIVKSGRLRGTREETRRLGRSRAVRFARPNRRACSQAINSRDTWKTSFYFHFIFNILSFDYSRISRGR